MLWLLLVACAERSVWTDLEGVEVLTVRQHYNNSHLVRTSEATVLVDAGFEEDAPSLEQALLAEAGVGFDDLDALIVTHGHGDHAGGASLVQDAGVPLVAGEGDLGLMAAGANDALCATDRIGRNRLEENEADTYPPVVPDEVVPMDASLEVAGMTVVSVPGHTEGTVVVRVGPAVFAGDLYRGAVGGKGARRHSYMCDLEDNTADLRQLLDDIGAGATTFFPGHFGPHDRDSVERLVTSLEE